MLDSFKTVFKINEVHADVYSGYIDNEHTVVYN